MELGEDAVVHELTSKDLGENYTNEEGEEVAEEVVEEGKHDKYVKTKDVQSYVISVVYVLKFALFM